jgi:hypothetical protein
MFRFSVRDLLWLTLVVAVALGWFVRERQLRGEVDQANKWRMAVGALQRGFDDEGWRINVNFDASTVEMFHGGPPKNGVIYRVYASRAFAEPTD